MCVSEITMARLNFSNVIAHFSHSGVDFMADNTCHFGINSFYADGGVKPGHGEDTDPALLPRRPVPVRRLPEADLQGRRPALPVQQPRPPAGPARRRRRPALQGQAVRAGQGLRRPRRPGRGGGYVVAFGECVYRSLDAVITLKEAGTTVGLINKPTLNVVDPAMMKTLAAAPWVLVVEGYNVKTGLGSRFGSYLLQAGFKGKYDHIGVHKEGSGWAVAADGLPGAGPEGDCGESIKKLA